MLRHHPQNRELEFRVHIYEARSNEDGTRKQIILNTFI